MFFKQIFRYLEHEALPHAAGAETVESDLTPEEYFNGARIGDIGTALGRLNSIQVKNIGPID